MRNFSDSILKAIDIRKKRIAALKSEIVELEKQIPANPEWMFVGVETSDYYYRPMRENRPHCPKCLNRLSNKNKKCDKCGQLIDWEEE